jgi:hypothetical protein
VETGVPLVHATGEPFDVGYQHGAARADALRAFVDDDLCRISRLAPAPVSVESLRPALAAYGAAIAAATPPLSEEIDGLARGAGISRELAVLLQVRREIIGFQRVPAGGDCTTYASLSAGPGGGPVLAQTVDLNGDLDDQIAVLDAGLSGSTRRALVLSFGGHQPLPAPRLHRPRCAQRVRAQLVTAPAESLRGGARRVRRAGHGRRRRGALHPARPARDLRRRHRRHPP